MKHKKSECQQAFNDGEINGRKWEQVRIIEYCKEQMAETLEIFKNSGFYSEVAVVSESQYQDVIDFIRGKYEE